MTNKLLPAARICITSRHVCSEENIFSDNNNVQHFTREQYIILLLK